ncbi:hypothetical protein FRC19_006293 [Serendipita sp. 401]|nr:hypothetical protein FRC19_006293 [Serendipita sp. 401]
MDTLNLNSSPLSKYSRGPGPIRNVGHHRSAAISDSRGHHAGVIAGRVAHKDRQLTRSSFVPSLTSAFIPELPSPGAGGDGLPASGSPSQDERGELVNKLTELSGHVATTTKSTLIRFDSTQPPEMERPNGFDVRSGFGNLEHRNCSTQPTLPSFSLRKTSLLEPSRSSAVPLHAARPRTSTILPKANGSRRLMTTGSSRLKHMRTNTTIIANDTPRTHHVSKPPFED